MSEIPTGPQLRDANLPAMTDDDLYRLATAVSAELMTVEQMYVDGDISSDELLWVREDAEKLQAEFERRGDNVGVEELFRSTLSRMVLRPEFADLFSETTKQAARENLEEG